MANIRDVARHAGVSVSTVSNVLNGRVDQMRKDTLARIEQAMAALQYQPNRAAQQLKTGQVKMLGLLVPSIVNPSFAALVREIELAAKQNYGYQVLLGDTHRQQEEEIRFLDDLLALGIRGVVVASTFYDRPHFRDALKRGLVMINYDERTLAAPGEAALPIDSVSMDNCAAGSMAAQHLIAQGCRRIAFATASGMTSSRANKIAGYRQALENAGLPAWVIEGKAQFAYGDAEMAELGKTLAEQICQSDPRPDGIVALNDMLAIGMISAFQRLGVRVPEDISVVGIDNMFLSELFNPALSSVAPPLREMAVKIVDRLIGRLENPELPVEEFLFAPSLVRRQSVINT
ncbi:Degradation activator [Serratia liquefaciens]|uniref:LacI family DNA-binding transcriptional regulator n=1 Tax=Serratia TaxID=613 RepID=UPI00218402F0|nr:LacI family DNA-binding transcriptional regulator [Serratia liquefaciens]CAI2516210.1 Degradation activator [Serratia liquefaciens]HCT9095469.1 LacI family DNA-binding transcriptional regulator [Serratia liquefaciens]